MSAQGMGVLDAVKLELVWTRLISAVDEAAKAIIRTSFSTLSNEANDFTCVLTDAQARSLAQNTGSIPGFIGTLPNTVRAICEAIPEAGMRPGDIYVTNNPWIGTGHLNDICLVRPIFHGGRIVAYGATTSHLPDIGGRLRSTEARELVRGRLPHPAHAAAARCRTECHADQAAAGQYPPPPDQTEGDIWTQASAVTLIGDRVVATLEDHGLADLDAVATEIFDRSEAARTARLREVSDGNWSAAFETDGMEHPFHLAVKVTLKNGQLLADFTGSSPQQPRPANCPFTYTRAMTWFVLKAMLLPELPSNDGIFRPIHLQLPEGCILNPREPAPVGGRAATGRHRGGLGHETEIECEADGIAAVFVTERIKYPAPGLFGGGPGEVLIDGKPANTRMQQTLNKGTRVIIHTPGGGGYGQG